MDKREQREQEARSLYFKEMDRVSEDFQHLGEENYETKTLEPVSVTKLTCLHVVLGLGPAHGYDILFEGEKGEYETYSGFYWRYDEDYREHFFVLDQTELDSVVEVYGLYVE